MRKIIALVGLVASFASVSAFSNPQVSDSHSVSYSRSLTESVETSDPSQARLDSLADSSSTVPVDANVTNGRESLYSDYILLDVADLEGDRLSPGSFVGIARDSRTDEVVATVVLTSEKVGTETFHVTYVVNGEIVFDRTMSESRAQQELIERYDSPTLDQPTLAAASGWSKFLACMTAAGVSTVVVLAIAGACASICAVTVGAGCVPCVLGFSALAGGAVGACIARLTG